MDKSLTVEKDIIINADVEQVWEALTNPETISTYFFGVEVICEWEVGSPIIFEGEYSGQSFKDKGNILKLESNKLLQYDYWSSFSGLEDIPENYSLVTYRLESQNGDTHVKLTQQGFADEEGHAHANTSWSKVLNELKKVVEGNK